MFFCLFLFCCFFVCVSKPIIKYSWMFTKRHLKCLPFTWNYSAWNETIQHEKMLVMKLQSKWHATTHAFLSVTGHYLHSRYTARSMCVLYQFNATIVGKCLLRRTSYVDIKLLSTKGLDHSAANIVTKLSLNEVGVLESVWEFLLLCMPQIYCYCL